MLGAFRAGNQMGNQMGQGNQEIKWVKPLCRMAAPGSDLIFGFQSKLPFDLLALLS